MKINLKIRKVIADYEFYELDFLELENKQQANEIIELYARKGSIKAENVTPINTTPVPCEDEHFWPEVTTYTTTASVSPLDNKNTTKLSGQIPCKLCNHPAKPTDNSGKVVMKNGEVLKNKAGYPIYHADYVCVSCKAEAWLNKKTNEFFWKEAWKGNKK